MRDLDPPTPTNIDHVATDLAARRASRPPDEPEDRVILEHIETHIELYRESGALIDRMAILAGALALVRCGK